ncbi:MAG: cytochrome c peroxidase [Polyangiales bacterium]
MTWLWPVLALACVHEVASPAADGGDEEKPRDRRVAAELTAARELLTQPWPDYVTMPPTQDSSPEAVARVALGRRLFYEQRLSLDGATSCASCHDPARGFSVAEPTHRGAAGDHTPRNAPGLANVAFASYLTWSNLTFLSLESQTVNPLFGDNPIELGAGRVPGDDVQASLVRLDALVAADKGYAVLFAAAFGDRAISWDHAISALAAFERTLLAFDAPYDGYLRGEPDALSDAEERGRVLFFSERLHCGECHAGPLLSLAFPVDGVRPTRDVVFRNTGLYNLASGAVAYLNGDRTRYPLPNIGIGEFSQDSRDDGKFRIPSLRNVTETAPYMHDGRFTDLNAVLDHYARAGTLTEAGPLAGDGRDHPSKDPRITGFTLTSAERVDLLAFLGALTDRTFVDNPHNPHNPQQRAAAE